ncbi:MULTISPECIES: TfoX/Sxy family protein [unclassified Ekhidna]|jgi:DNA transformation protein|uniref:TfoX/Sxy family protein n=1 Tax=unclassified Ekhidna TaxID=2632188 RepID=UPI0032DF4F60
MGQKGAKHTNEAQLSADLVIEKLSPIEGITSKKMFGGHGIFQEGKMFGMVDSKGKISLKVDEALEKEYLSIGGTKHGKMPYYSVPDDILNSEEFVHWAKKSIAIK